MAAVETTSLSPEVPFTTSDDTDANDMTAPDGTFDTSSASDLGGAFDSNLLLLAATAADAEVTPCTLDQGTQTEASSVDGPLHLLLSASDGCHGSTQVAYHNQSHKVTSTDGSWRRQCGFHGYSSLKTSEQATHDLCSVTLMVFSILLNMLPGQHCHLNEMTWEDRLALFLMKLKLGISFTALTSLFGVSKAIASRAFKSSLEVLSFMLKDWVYVPP